MTVTRGVLCCFPRYWNLLGFAAAWSDPAASELSDRTTLEAFYRYQFSNNIAVTADLQLIIDLALNPHEGEIAVFGLRARVDI